MLKNKRFLLMKCVICIFSLISVTASVSDLQLLITVKSDWGSPSELNSWDNTSETLISYCDWRGVVCNGIGKVIQLNLPHLNLQGPVPHSICKLQLEQLDISFNEIRGTFPTALFQCTNLISLNLSSKGINGPVPEDIRQLSKLRYLRLGNNYLSRSLPSSIGELRALEILTIEENSFSGRLPAEALGQLTNLSVLMFSNNVFEPGPVPQTFSKLKWLNVLSARHSSFTGTVDEQLFGLTELQELDLSANNLQGEIPNWIWLHRKLKVLILSSNQFHGEIGPEMRCDSMLSLKLSSNNLSGAIPEIGDLSSLVSIELDANRFSGKIPLSMGMMSNLMLINLSRNHLSGEIPENIGNYSVLQVLDLSMNSLSGDLPDNLCYQNNLETLIVSHNHLTGFPISLSKCNTLKTIMASNNAFTGNFPESIWSNCENLKLVFIEDNKLTGTLPMGLSRTITEINIANNQFSDTIPISAVGLKKFIAANNNFSHALPAEMTNLANLTHLQLHGNRIGGSIPPSIVSLQKIVVLNLSKNYLTGEVPSVIGFLPELKKLDLSFNRLTGAIPASLVRWAFKDSFNGNFLSANTLLYLPHCSKNRGGKKQNIIIGVSSGVSFIVLIAVSITVWKICKREQRACDTSSWKLVPFGPIQFNLSDIINNLREDQIIGRGSAKVFRVDFNSEPGKTVAVKVLEKYQKDDEEREFEAEIRALGSIRHKNIVKLLCYIFSRDKRMLVYEFIANSTLAQWLHGGNHRGRQGGLQEWTTRLSIAIDIATALKYMHTELEKPIVHCDVKSSNVLLNSSFMAKLGDFGLAREVGSGQLDSMSNIRGTYGYMAPEYAIDAKVSVTQDIYSFGVILLELVTGRKPLDNGLGVALAEWAVQRHHRGAPFTDVFYRVIDSSGHGSLVKLFKLGVDCVNYNPPSRPRMDEVFHRLKIIWEESGHGNSSLFSIPILSEESGHGNSSFFSIPILSEESGHGNSSVFSILLD